MSLTDIPVFTRTDLGLSLGQPAYSNVTHLPVTSHQEIWQHLITNNIPVATVFFEKVEFHPLYKDLSTDFMDATPEDWDVIFIGNWLQHHTDHYVDRQPTAKSFAYMITLEGAKKLLAKWPMNMSATALEQEMFQCMVETPLAFTWYCWSGIKFPCDLGDETGTGLVFM